MSETPASSAEPSDVLNREAAQWFARMRGPDADALRPALEAWLAQDAARRVAYNRAAEIFAMGKLLAEEAMAPPAALSQRPRAKGLTLILAATGLSVLAASGWIMTHPGILPHRVPTALPAKAGQAEIFATLAGETRAIRLADGSLIELDSDSKVAVQLGASDRELRLLNGEARFAVAHEHRPFVVLAGGGSITARGTIFKVALSPAGRVAVELLDGAIDVALPRGGRNAPLVRQLRPGERITFETPSPAPPAPTAAMRDYQAITLAALVAEANRDAARPIRLASPALGEQRVSGRFRIDDTERLAERLAALFDSEVDLSNEREIVLIR